MNILVTDKEEGPKGWEMIPVQDEYVFYNPKKVSEEKITQLTEDYANGDMDEMYELAEFDTELDREE
jgi:hypothetical protein